MQIVLEQFKWPAEWRKKALSIAKKQGKTKSEWFRDVLSEAIEAEGKVLKTEAPKRGGKRKGAGRKPNAEQA